MSAAVVQDTRLDVYGLRLGVGGDWPEVVDALRKDFAFFEREDAGGTADVEVTVERRPPDLDRFGPLLADYVTEQHVVYRAGGQTIVDYLGRAVAVLEARSAVVQGEDAHAVRRAAYDFLVSRAADYLDASALPRIFGLGLSGLRGGVLVLLPPGGGKTTLALQALGQDGVGFLSEVSPLIDRHGRLHAFPFPLWVRDSAVEAAELPDEYVRRLDGQQTDPRLLELEAFVDRIPRNPQQLRHIVLARRSLAHTSRLLPVSRREAVTPLFRQSVVGFSMRQGLSFLLRRGGARDPAKEQREADTPTAFRSATAAARARTRLRCCGAGLAGAQVWRLELGRDRAGGWRALEPLFR